MPPEEGLSPADLTRFTMPVWVLTGRDDGVIRRTLAWYRQHLPDHAVMKEVEYFDAPMAEQPAVFTAELRTYLVQLKERTVAGLAMARR